MTRYLENLNDCTDPTTGDYLWIYDASAGSTDKDRKVNVSEFALTGAATTFSANPTVSLAAGKLTIVSTGTSDGATLNLNSTGSGGRNFSIVSTQADNPGGAGTLLIYDATAAASRLMIDAVGNVKLGGTAARASTVGTHALHIFNGTAPVGTLANGCSFYSTSGEMRVMDAAGNATLLSPHDSAGRWIFDSTDTVTGRRLVIDVEKMLRALNEMFGWDFVRDFVTETGDNHE